MKKQLKTIPLLYPVPIVLIGAYVDNKENYANVGDVAIMGINPPLMAISLSETHYTTKGINKNKIFSINIPSADMMEKVDYCGIYSGFDVDKSILFTNIKGQSGAPIIDECPVNIECKVVEEITIQHRHIFIGEVLHTSIDEKYVTQEDGRDKICDMQILNPLIYSLDNKYYTIGKSIGEGYKEGKKLNLK